MLRYPLFAYSTTEDTWNGFQFHREDREEGMAVVFRRGASTQDSADSCLQGLSPTVTYELRFQDSGTVLVGTGVELSQPLHISLTNAPGSELMRYSQQPEE